MGKNKTVAALFQGGRLCTGGMSACPKKKIDNYVKSGVLLSS